MIAKINIEDISFTTYLSLKDKSKYDYCIRYADKLKEPLDIFEIGDFIEQPFGLVKDLQELLNHSGMTWQSYFDTLLKHGIIKSYAQAGAMSLFTLQRSRVYIKTSIETINKLESDGLGHTPSPDEEIAGIDRFNKYRSFYQLDKLAGGDVTKYEAVRKEPYGNCFTKLMLESDKAAYDIELNKVRKRRNNQ